jgi:hypothetical protein
MSFRSDSVQGYEMVIDTGKAQNRLRWNHIMECTNRVMRRRLINSWNRLHWTKSAMRFRITSPKPHQNLLSILTTIYGASAPATYVSIWSLDQPVSISSMWRRLSVWFRKATHFYFTRCLLWLSSSATIPASAIKTFFAPMGVNILLWCLSVFNAVVFTAMMYDLKELWDDYVRRTEFLITVKKALYHHRWHFHLYSVVEDAIHDLYGLVWLPENIISHETKKGSMVFPQSNLWE